MSNYVITIGREFESLGIDIGRTLAERLGIKCYNKELLSRAAKESGLCEEIFHAQDEKPTNSFLYSLVMDTYSATGYTAAPFLDMPLNHKIFLAQFDTIKKLAEEESCIIVGRCADYVLKGYPNVVRLFIYAEKEACIREVVERFRLSEKEAARKIETIDKERSAYYKYHTGRDWENAMNYDLCLNSGELGLKKCVQIVRGYMKVKFDQ